ncbi:MAG: protein-L-isoaspartate(D-aspartate) O-methyltransferase [Candidatus Omnitrophota bacterium]
MNYETLLLNMLQRQVVARGIRNPRILEAMQRVPRHLFVPEECRDQSYDDKPLALPEDRATISQPYMVAYMTDALQCQSTDRILEIGTGSGYQAAVLSCLCREVYTIERHYTLSINAQRTAQSIGRENIFYRTGDGLQGWREKAPFDKIVVTAAARKTPLALIEQLKEDGVLLIPLGPSEMQILTSIRKKNGKGVPSELISCVFVPLISKNNDLTQVDLNEESSESSSQ